MSAPQRFEIVYSPAVAEQVSRYVVRGFFGPRELPQALARMLLTGEFALFVGVPVLMLLAARLAPAVFPDKSDEWALGLTVIAILWLLAGLFRIARYGPSSGIGCYALDANGQRGTLAGGLRLRLERGQRRVWIAGLLVEPEWRGEGIGTALVLAAFRLALQEAAQGAVKVSVFAPSHPASKAIVARQLGGHQTLALSQPPIAEAMHIISNLEATLMQSHAEFRWSLARSEHGLFARRAANPKQNKRDE